MDVFDVSSATAKWLTTIPTAAAPNGLVIADDVHEVFVGLNNSTVEVIDVGLSSSNYDKVIATINTGGKHRGDEAVGFLLAHWPIVSCSSRSSSMWH